MSDCNDHEVNLSSWLDGQLDRPGQVETLDHLVRCAACREFYRDARALDGMLASVREPADTVSPGPEVRRRIEQAVRPRRTGWGTTEFLRVAAVLVISVGLGWFFWGGLNGVTPSSEIDVQLGERAGRMSEQRFFELTTEVLQAEPRYHTVMYEVMEQVLRDTADDEASIEGSRSSAAAEEDGEEESESESRRSRGGERDAS